jgi:hypothetical protein
MAIERLPMDSLPEIIKAGQIDAIGMRGLTEESDGIQTVERFRKGAEKIIQDFDARWIALCKSDVNELTEWACRMRSVRERFDEIDRQLAVKGTRLFKWEPVLVSMGFINAFRVAIEQTLDHNEQTVA